MSLRSTTLIGAVLLVVAVVGGVLLFAVPRPPALPALSAADGDASLDPGRVAWTTWESDGRCLTVVDATGDRVRHCDVELDGEVVGWDDGKVLLTSYVTTEPRTIEVDPRTGASRSGGPGQDGSRDRSRAELQVERDDGRLTVEVEGQVVWEVDAPAEYTVTWAQRSADGELVLLGDRAGRLLVVPADGSRSPHLFVEDVPSWSEVAWERAAH